MTATQVSAPAGRELQTAVGAIRATFPGRRTWRTRDGDLAARKGGCPPPGAHARGRSLAELTHAIETVLTTGLPPALAPAEQAALGQLTAAATPLPVRAICGATGLHLTATAKSLASLRTRGLATRHRRGRGWLCTHATPANNTGERQPGGHDGLDTRGGTNVHGVPDADGGHRPGGVREHDSQ